MGAILGCSRPLVLRTDCPGKTRPLSGLVVACMSDVSSAAQHDLGNKKATSSCTG